MPIPVTEIKNEILNEIKERNFGCIDVRIRVYEMH